MYKIIGTDLKEYGPISAETLRQWIAEGRVNANTRVQTEGTLAWVTLAQMPEFGVTMPVSTPPTLVMPPSGPAKNNLANWAFGVSIFSLVCCQHLGGIVSLVLGILALTESKKLPNEEGKGFAIAAIVIGAACLIITVIFGILYFSIFSEAMKHGFPK